MLLGTQKLAPCCCFATWCEASRSAALACAVLRDASHQVAKGAIASHAQVGSTSRQEATLVRKQLTYCYVRRRIGNHMILKGNLFQA